MFKPRMFIPVPNRQNLELDVRFPLKTDDLPLVNNVEGTVGSKEKQHKGDIHKDPYGDLNKENWCL